jgi:hypothetical protein
MPPMPVAIPANCDSGDGWKFVPGALDTLVSLVGMGMPRSAAFRNPMLFRS